MRNSHRQAHPTPSAPAIAAAAFRGRAPNRASARHWETAAALVDAAHCPFAADDRVVLLDFLVGELNPV
jgi:hypothetical protein